MQEKRNNRKSGGAWPKRLSRTWIGPPKTTRASAAAGGKKAEASNGNPDTEFAQRREQVPWCPQGNLTGCDSLLGVQDKGETRGGYKELRKTKKQQTRRRRKRGQGS